ncbi:PAS domain-containing sensor histidine kinase [Vibrio sp. S4M6]|uniref:PAS domain-containing sensor histidine kinase n=1 Tax=Vibrio sinus TaxID=2946865 RepID=UPI00202A372F|nr:PAS domain-containing sensor histidine kinase [Vibrio sinus]MCL9780960.1 PAS domain-containing sensor histidine kinase [Vibrio sinus]
MTFGRKLALLVVVVAILSAMVGYIFATHGVMSGLSWVFCFVLFGFTVWGARRLYLEVANKYYWYEQMLDSLPTPLSVTDLEMNWTFINKPVEQLFDEPKKEFVGKQCHHWGAAICQTEKCGVWRLRKGETETFFSQFDREFRVDTHYLYSLSGEPVGHVEVCTDITAILGIEKAYDDLKHAQRTLVESEKMASLGSLVAGVAHEVNTPIGVSMTSSTFIQSQLAEFKQGLTSGAMTQQHIEELLDDVEKGVELIQSNLKRSVELITSFKQVAVTQASDEHCRFNLEEHLHQVLSTHEQKLKQKQVIVEAQCIPEFEIDSYPEAFAQIYSNLILNSLIHGFEAANAPHEISICLSKAERVLVIDYKDNGLGIEAALLAKIFDPFVTTKRGQGGCGLGTHIIYNLVTHKLHGTIQCHSEPGNGCHFHIEIPLDSGSSFKDRITVLDKLKIDTRVSYE